MAQSHMVSVEHTSLPDALWGVDDGLHDVVSDELPVLLRDVVDGRLGGGAVSLTPVLGDHVLKVDHTWEGNTPTGKTCTSMERALSQQQKKRPCCQLPGPATYSRTSRCGGV